MNYKELGEDPVTETTQVLNPNLRGRDIREAFKTDGFSRAVSGAFALRL